MAAIERYIICILLKGIALYQFLGRPWVGYHCRFYPSCSHYAQLSLERHGALKGCYLTIKRLLKCHPFHEGGIDEVPEQKK